jgi:hypothetical protein
MKEITLNKSFGNIIEINGSNYFYRKKLALILLNQSKHIYVLDHPYTIEPVQIPPVLESEQQIILNHIMYLQLTSI